MPLERITKDPSVLGERVRECLPEPLEQPRRALDVGEQRVTVPVGNEVTLRTRGWRSLLVLMPERGGYE